MSAFGPFGPGGTATAASGTISVATTLTQREWGAFARRFIAPDGRVVDVEKGGVSHSESQGYGMLLAVQANDRATFDRILRFTFGHMRGRDDHLVSWIYDPRADPPITDVNNASDGDIFIAYALVKAAIKWNDVRYLALAEPMVDDIGRLLLTERGGRTVLRPGAFGFDRHDHRDGPVINLSYYVYSAFSLFEKVAAHHPFDEAWQSGLSLTRDAIRASRGHAPDWVTLRNERIFQPARGFAPKSSYDAVRIPLYMAMSPDVPAHHFEPFDRAWNLSGRRAPEDFDLRTRRTLMIMNDPGYRAIAALAGCVARGAPIPAALQVFRPTTYFASALHLMTLSAARANHPHCVQRRPYSADFAGGEETITVVAGSRLAAGRAVPLPNGPARRGPLGQQALPGFGGRPAEHQPTPQSGTGHFVM